MGEVNKIVREHKVPDSLFINWDRTECQIVPVCEWTMEGHGSTQVTVAGLENKRQITVFIAAPKDGTFLPRQVNYAGRSADVPLKMFDFQMTAILGSQNRTGVRKTLCHVM
jgi:hypothetical protein